MAASDGLVRVPGSFDRFYEREYAAVVGLMYGMTRSRVLAEDLAQEAFLRAHRDWSRVEHMDSPEGWVRRTALNIARSRWRRLRSEARALMRSASGDTSSGDHRTSPEIEAFWSEVKRLPARQAQAIALHYVEDLSVSEIGTVLGVADGTVKALLHQGRERLRRQLRSKGFIDEV
jgi:RNA polymerase sigma-70 factor (ECF subfamily)